jgi:hypothetical protein
MTVLQRCDIECVDVFQQVLETRVRACSVLPGELFRLNLAPSPHAGREAAGKRGHDTEQINVRASNDMLERDGLPLALYRTLG